MNKEELQNNYQSFFDLFKIDKTTGVLEEYPNIKFATMPYIGTKYHCSKKRILFVGMDIGQDETPGRYQSFRDRNASIEVDRKYNPHIAGTYCAALYLLKETYNWENAWNDFSKFQTYSRATKFDIHHKQGENPLSYIALTNLHKFVTENRINRTGDSDRKFLNKKMEENFLLEEVKLLKPQLIFFQGKLPSATIILEIKNLNIQIIKAPHPSNREKDGRNPLNYISRFQFN